MDNIVNVIEKIIVPIVTILISSITSIIIAYYTVKGRTKFYINSEIDEQKQSIFKKAKEIISSTEFQNPMLDEDKAQPHTEEIDENRKQKLSLFTEKNKTKIDILEFFDLKIPTVYNYYYNFAVYYAFVLEKASVADYYIVKALDELHHDEQNNISIQQKDKIDIFRWAARIKRLNHDHSQAGRLLTDILDMTNGKKEHLLFEAKTYRSRGACNFNIYKYTEAISDFQKSIALGGVSDSKTPYSYCAIAMSYYKLYSPKISDSNKNEIISFYRRAIEKDALFFGDSLDKLNENIYELESKKKYYFSGFEKEALIDVYNLYRHSEANGGSLG